MTPPNSPEQRVVGAFLLGTAALAIFDIWFPGLIFLLGLCLLGYSRWRDEMALAGRAGVMLVLVSITYLLWRWMGTIAPDYIFPMAMMLLAVVILLRFDITNQI